MGEEHKETVCVGGGKVMEISILSVLMVIDVGIDKPIRLCDFKMYSLAYASRTSGKPGRQINSRSWNEIFRGGGPHLRHGPAFPGL